jgi:hypothetical protein
VIDPESLSVAVASGDRREALEAIRGKLAAELGAAFGRDAAAIAKELSAVVRELDDLPTGREASRVDELARRRAGRIAAGS